MSEQKKPCETCGRAPYPLVHGKIIAVMRELTEIKKGQENKHQHWKFRGIDDVYNAVQPYLRKHGLYTAPELIKSERKQVATRNGGQQEHVVSTYRYHVYAEDGSSISVDAIGEAADNGDKAAGKASSYAHKDCFLRLFAVPTEDLEDPDEVVHEFVQPPRPPVNQRVEAPPPPQPREMTEEQKRVHMSKMVQKIMGDEPDMATLEEIYQSYTSSNVRGIKGLVMTLERLGFKVPKEEENDAKRIH